MYCLFLASLLYCSVCIVLHQHQDALTTVVLQLYCKSKSGRRSPDLFVKTIMSIYTLCILTSSLESCLPIPSKKKAIIILIEARLRPQITLERIDNHPESSNPWTYNIFPFTLLHLGLNFFIVIFNNRCFKHVSLNYFLGIWWFGCFYKCYWFSIWFFPTVGAT